MNSPPQALGLPARTTGSRRIQSRRPPQAANALPPGFVVGGRYRIQALLGVGGMGAVYRAEHVSMRRTVAVKVLRTEHAADATMAQRFEREAQATSRIHSPFVISVYDFGRGDDGLLYLAMELLEGESLASRLDRRGELPWPDALKIVGAVSRALQAVHEAGVVHRDIKPDNIFLCSDASVKLLDFGIARFVDTDPEIAPSAKLTQAGSVIGTALYVSPEACAQKPIGPGADLYAVGAMLFEMLTGRWVFTHEEPVMLMSAHLQTTPERLSEVRPDLDFPPALEALVARLLAKKPEQRPRAAARLAEEVHEILAEYPHPAPRSDGEFPDDSTLVERKPRGVREAVTTHVGADTRVDPARRLAPRLILGGVVVAMFALLAALAGWMLGGGVTPPDTIHVTTLPPATSPPPTTPVTAPSTTPPATVAPATTDPMGLDTTMTEPLPTTSEPFDPVDLAPTTSVPETPRMRRTTTHEETPPTTTTPTSSMTVQQTGLIDMF